MLEFWEGFCSAFNVHRALKRYFAPLTGAIRGALKETHEAWKD